MTYGGYGGGPADPFGGDPFGGSPGASGPTPAGGYGFPGVPPGTQGYPPAGPPSHAEVNTLATLSIVFAVVFAPAGAALGHVALHQIRHRGQRGRDRALIGLTLSYVVIVAAVIGLVLWSFNDDAPDATATTATTTTTTTTTTTRAAPPPAPRTTVITAPPTVRPTVDVDDLQVGDCVEVQQNEPVPGDPTKNYVVVYPASCQVRDGIAVVDRITTNKNDCPGLVLINAPETRFACVSDFKG